MENGTPLPLCDREILSKCIAIWFGHLGLKYIQMSLDFNEKARGSEENFEKEAGAMVLAAGLEVCG